MLMRSHLLLAVPALCGLMLLGCQSTPTDDNTAAVDPLAAAIDDLPTARVEALGMGCPLCATNVDEVIGRMPGVEAVRVDLGNGLIHVGLTPEADWPTPAQLEEAVRDAGFTPKSVTMPEGGDA